MGNGREIERENALNVKNENVYNVSKDKEDLLIVGIYSRYLWHV